MKSLIKKLLRENLLDEVSDELYNLIKTKHSGDRIIMSKYDTIEFDSNMVVDNVDEGFLSSKMDKFKDSWNKFMDAAKREGKETAMAAEILYRLLNPKTINGVTGKEKKFLKEQSKDLLKIATVAGLGVISMAIPIALEKILNKRGKSIMPKDNMNNDLG
jgi:hypothetical protein